MDAGGDSVGGELAVAQAGVGRGAAGAQRAIAAALFGAPPVVVGHRYRLGERLGAGAQGSVWRAFDERLARDVAIKANHVESLPRSSVTESWLRHEAQMLGRVSHPNVVTVFNVGLHPAAAFGGEGDGMVLYLVLEFVRGQTLAAWLAERPRSVDEIGAMFTGVAAGLQAVHDAGLVHCDIKPTNILVTEHGIAKLGDFGLAHVQRALRARANELRWHAAADTSGAEDSATDGPVGGTPLYMPPEQFDNRIVGVRADQYALAATWFEALFGVPPHRGRHAFELGESKRAGAPVRPSSRLSRSRYAALARALDPDPEQRFGSVAELASELTRDASRRRWALGATGGALLAGLVAWAAMPTTTDGCRPADFEAERATRIAQQIPDRVATYDEHLAGRFTATWNDHVDARIGARQQACALPAPSAPALACLDGLARLGAAAIDPDALRGRRAIERALSIAGSLPDPAACLEGASVALRADERIEDQLAAVSAAIVSAQDRQREGHPGEALRICDAIEVSPVVGAVYRNEIELVRAEAMVALGRFDEAERAYQGVWDRALAGHAPIDATRAAGGLAHVVGFEQGHADAGLAWVRHGRSQLERFGEAPLFDAELRGVSAAIRGTAGDVRGAIEELEGAIALMAAATDDRDVEMGMRENLALFLAIDGDLDGAEPGLHEVLAWREAEYGESHPEVARSLTNLAYVERQRGDASAAQRHLDRALAIQEESSDRSELEIAKIETSRARLALERHDHAPALASLDRAQAIRERMLPGDHPDLAMGVIMRVDILLDAGDIEGADAIAQGSRDRLAAVSATGTDAALALDYTLARIDALSGRNAKALAGLTQAIDQAERRTSPPDSLAQWCVQAAALAGSLGDLDGARTWTDRAEQHLATAATPDAVKAQIAALREAIAAAR